MRSAGEEEVARPKQDDDSQMLVNFEEQEYQHDSTILSVDTDGKKHDIKLVDGTRRHASKSTSSDDNKPSIANNRTVVLMITFLQGLAKES